MLLSRALSRGSRALGAVSALKNLQRPAISSEFHSFVHESPKKYDASPRSLLQHSRLHFNAFQRIGISWFAFSGNKNGSVSDADKLVADMIKFLKEIRELVNAEVKDAEVVKYKVRMLSKLVRGMVESDIECDAEIGLEIVMNAAELMKEIEELGEAKLNLIKEIENKVVGTLDNVITKIICVVENSKKLGTQNLQTSGRLSTHVKGSSTEVDESIDTASEQLKFAMEDFSRMKVTSEDISSQLQSKLDELRKALELLQQFHGHVPAVYIQYGLTVAALCIIWLLTYGN